MVTNDWYIISLVKVAEKSIFGKGLLTRLATYTLCIMSICNFSYFPFRF